MAVVVGVAGPGDVEIPLLRCGDDGGHGEGGGAVHADLAVPVAGHEAEGGIGSRVQQLDGEIVLIDDAGPVVDAGSAKGVDGELEGGVLQHVEVDDVAEVVDVGGEEVVLVGGEGGAGLGVGDALEFGGRQAGGEEGVGAIFDPLGGTGVGRAAVGWVVLEAAIFGGGGGGGDDDAVGEFGDAVAVVGEDGV